MVVKYWFEDQEPLSLSGNCNHRTLFVIGDNISFDSVWMVQCRQTEGCFKRHAKSSLFGVAFDQPASNSEAF